MNAADVAAAMAQAGCSPEQIATTLRVLVKPKSSNAERQKRYRERVTLRNETLRYVTPPKQKEPFPPTPPLLEKLIPPLGLAEARPVDESVHESVRIEKIKKNSGLLLALGTAWNQLAESLRLPAIDEIKSGSVRERQALARLREMPETGITDLMARIRGSPYLRGERNGFVCSFDWVIKPSNFQKVMEGNYEDRKKISLVSRR